MFARLVRWIRFHIKTFGIDALGQESATPDILVAETEVKDWATSCRFRDGGHGARRWD
jgi:hypothetical protein